MLNLVSHLFDVNGGKLLEYRKPLVLSLEIVLNNRPIDIYQTFLNAKAIRKIIKMLDQDTKPN